MGNEVNEDFNLEPDIRRKYLSKFKNAGVSKIFCGHYHRNAGGWDGDLELVITSAIGCQIGDDPHGMRLVEVMKHDIKHQYYGLEDFPTNIIRELKTDDAIHSRDEEKQESWE